jgi:hypothetical protein
MIDLDHGFALPSVKEVCYDEQTFSNLFSKCGCGFCGSCDSPDSVDRGRPENGVKESANTKGGTTMATYSEWIMKSARLGAALGGVAGFLYGTYIMAASLAFSWADILDTAGSVAAMLVFAAAIGSLCIAIGWLAGLVLGIVASPLRSFTEER